MEIEKAVLYALRETDFPEYHKVNNPNGVIPVIANLDQPEPRPPYLLIDVINTTKVGMPYRSVINDGIDIKEHMFQVKDFYMSLTLHATTKDASQEWFRHLEDGVHSDMVDWAFSQQGLALVESDNILYQSQPISGTAYKRAIMNVTLRAEVQEAYKVNFIQSVEIKGVLSGLTFTFFDNKLLNDSVLLVGDRLSFLVNEDLARALSNI